MLPSEASQLTLAQVFNLLRPSDKTRNGKPKRSGIRESVAIRREEAQMRAAAEDIRRSIELTEARKNG